jgi:iron(III) transport system ATP-binding protein
MVQLGGYENRASTQLSGGQQQRLAFARGLVRKPRLLLLDEPLSNLDAKLREQMRVELKRLQRTLGITTVYVTHDQSEALALSDIIAVFNQGRIVQRGSPRDIYRRPESQFVADFVGSANFLRGKVVGRNEDMTTVETPHGTIHCSFVDAVRPGDEVLITARPEDLIISEKHPGDGFNVFAGTIAQRVFLGEVTDYFVDLGEGREIRVRAAPEVDIGVGRPVHVAIRPQQCVGLVA